MAGCSTCSTTSGGTGGCQNNGTCGTSDCNKMNSFDWLAHMGIPQVDNFDIVEIKFKGGRKEYFRNVDYLSLNTGDPVVVDVPNGHHIGYVSLQGELVRLQMQKRKIRDDDNITRIYRIANQKDMEKWEEARNREMPTLYRCKQIVDELGLQMKMSDVEYQADNSKATFYYSAEDRVDFRELIKVLAGEFKIRVEMRQISLRQEAGRLGGIGVCGRELCCSTWLVDFKNVTTSAARYQNLSLNPTKLSGQCGRLKCCLNYELDTYMDAIKDIPQVEKPLQTEQGPAKLQKTDIFRKLMWFSYNNDNDWISITCDRVKEIQELNEQGIKVFNLQVDKSTDVEDLVAQSTRELELLDQKFAKNKKKKKKKKSPSNGNSPFPPRNGREENSPKPSPSNPRPEGKTTSNESKPSNQPKLEASGNQEKKTGGENRRRKKNRNRPNPKNGQVPNPPKAENKSTDSGNEKPESKRRFPPRRNQGPGNENKE
ncbi:PSP1-like protein [Algoriphagus boseongensis]|uniref:PSP1-like protein n=1 Tax=Algoriphagus boseongensis TaxID=1442587 RepID=A0A4R6T8G6_9BACT|nr:regulatory iron-sulfur-containing complex subunit RicT [Algoriphagus boseongensis]TDQ18453.1 PSP1-like protein [Algoriphagus boseongensis]